MLLHGLAAHFFIGIVVTEGQSILALGAFIIDLGDSWEVFFTHNGAECGTSAPHGQGERGSDCAHKKVNFAPALLTAILSLAIELRAAT